MDEYLPCRLSDLVETQGSLSDSRAIVPDGLVTMAYVVHPTGGLIPLVRQRQQVSPATPRDEFYPTPQDVEPAAFIDTRIAEVTLPGRHCRIVGIENGASVDIAGGQAIESLGVPPRSPRNSPAGVFACHMHVSRQATYNGQYIH
eukprot:scaffold40522_cov49-Prasinocladus_malaysianus.AAC.1